MRQPHPFTLVIDRPDGSQDRHGHYTAKSARLHAKRLAGAPGVTRLTIESIGADLSAAVVNRELVWEA